MAAGKLSPRQKMIGMMYLVLTALLALNVAREILDAFVTVNNGLENTSMSFDKDINALYAKFDEKKSIDPIRVTPNWTKAQAAKDKSKAMLDYLAALKKTLLRESEGFKNHEEDTIRLANVDGKERFDVTTRIMCGDAEDGTNGTAHELKGKLGVFKTDLLALLPAADAASMHLNLDTPDPTDGGEYRTWEMKTFYDSPLAANITILSKIENDVKSAEAEVVDALLRGTDSDIIPFDTVAARVIAKTSYVIQGEPYNAEIFLAAFNKTLTPKVYIGQYDSVSGKMVGAYDSLNVVNGLGMYSPATDKPGIFTYSGMIRMVTPKGQIQQYPFTQEYIVAPPAMSVAATKMNVMYAGLKNPISASVPGFAKEKTHVSVSNGVLSTNSKGELEVSGLKAGTCVVSITVDGADGKPHPMGTMEFRVKNLPKPQISVSGCPADGGRVKASVLAAALGISSVYPYTDFEDAKCKVTTYHISVFQNNIGILDKDYTGNLFDPAVKKIFAGLKKGAHVYIEEVKTSGPDGVNSATPLSFIIN
jgi:gliding motility-associated protein GldM